MIDAKTKSEYEKNHTQEKLIDSIDKNARIQDYNNQELDESVLLSKALDLYSNDPGQTFSAIIFFDDYLHLYRIPLTVSLKIQPFFIKLFSIDDIPKNISDPSLRIISSISSSFSDKFDYLSFFTQLWKYLPSSFAFDAISSLIISNNTAAVTIINPPFLPHLQKLFQSGNIQMISGALGIFDAIATHSELTNSLYEIFSQILELHKLADPSIKIQCFETFTNLISNQSWCNFFSTNDNLSIIFQIDSKFIYDAQILAALRFLNILILNSDINPETIISNANGMPLIMNGFSNPNQIIVNESVYIIENTLKKLTYIPQFIWACNIPQILMEKNNSIANNGDFKIFQFSIHSLCMICERTNGNEYMKMIINLNLHTLICDFIDSIDQRLLNDALLAILKIMTASTSLNMPQIILEISNNEQFIDFISNIHSEITEIILKLLTKIEIQEQK